MSKPDFLDHEETLVNELKREDPKAQEFLYARFGAKMLNICSRYCRNAEDSRDALQDGFVKIFLNIRQFNGRSALETWMTRIMINTAIDKFKKELRFTGFHNPTDRLPETPHENNLISFQEGGLDKEKVLQAIQDLPTGYRTVLNMYCVEGYSHRQISGILGISEGTSKSQLARARMYLKDLLRKKGIIG